MNADPDPQHWFKQGLYSLVSLNSFVTKSRNAEKSYVNKGAELSRHGIYRTVLFH
jgi:hypothetical protein